MWATVAVAGILGTGCGTDRPDAATSGLGEASARAVYVDTTGCGDAGPAAASGVLMSADLVATAAHVVADGDGTATVTLLAEGSDSAVRDAVVVAHDPRTDLALLRLVDGADVDDVTLSALSTQDAPATARLIGARRSGDVDGHVLRRVNIVIDAVRSTADARRLGYELALRSGGGDSGAGVYVGGPDGPELLGLLFASGDDGVSWVVAASA